MRMQFQNFRLAISNLQEDEVVIVADSSENYDCKYHQEIQAHHFGGSRQQVSLHTVVVYVTGKDKRNVESYCTVSASTNHQPAAIWAHLHPVLTVIFAIIFHILRLYIFSATDLLVSIDRSRTFILA